MKGHVLHCTVCNVNCSSVPPSWNRHFLKRSHQTKARNDLSQWDEDMRKCSVVVYSSASLLILAEKLLEYFSRFLPGKGKSMVTDLILSVSRPRTAILQFESKDKVTQLFAEIEGPTARIENQLVQLKKLETCLDFEWEDLVQNFQDESILCLPNVQENRKLLMSHHHPEASKDKSSQQSKKTMNVVEAGRLADSMMCDQFESIQKNMEISDYQFNIVKEVIQELKRVVEETLPNGGCHVELYRNNFLKLRNNSRENNPRNTYLINVYTVKEATGQFKRIPNMAKARLIRSFEGSEETRKSLLDNLKMTLISREEFELRFRRAELHMFFNLKSSPLPCNEVQLSRLVTFYCNFDPRIRPLFTLLYYWIKRNNISIASHGVAPANYSDTKHPVALEWLLLFFLFHHEKLVPIPREILERPHPALNLKLSCSRIVDLGFNEDLEWSRSWQRSQQNLPIPPLEGTPEFTLSVVHLLRNFFTFCVKNLSPLSVLNTRDGILTTTLKKQKKSSLPFSAKLLMITNPFVPFWMLTVDNYNWSNLVFPTIKRTAQELEAYLTSATYDKSLFYVLGTKGYESEKVLSEAKNVN